MITIKKPKLPTKLVIWLIAVCSLAGPSLLASTIYNADQIGIDNSNLPTEGTKTFGPVNNKESSLKKIAEALEISKQDIANQICDQTPTDKLCSTIPSDNTDFSELFVYLFITAVAQNSFDIFSWQSFVGLNWPANADGMPMKEFIGDVPNSARVWTTYKTPRQIFDKNYRDEMCSANTELDNYGPYLETDVFLQTSGKPLIDKNLNFIVYDIRVNDVLADYIEQNNLTTLEGQQAFMDSGQEIDYPVGYYEDPIARSGGHPGSIAIKTAWKIIDAESGDDPASYYTVNGLIRVSADDSETGQAFCLQERLGLIGMHIMTRTESGSGRNWTWSTFEHIYNAPLAANSRRPADILQKKLFDGGCQGPSQVDRNYALFNPDCSDCQTNHIETANWKWSDEKPYARTSSLNQSFGTQVARCWQVFEGTQVINEIWQEKLKHSVWSNYRLLSAQWKGGNRGMMFPEGEVPRFLTNPVLETYDQYSGTSSCLSCHSTARSLTGQDSKFSFLLGLPAKYFKAQ